MIRDRLFTTDPYDGLDPDLYPSDLHGWNYHEDHFRSVMEGTVVNTVVEVGSWKGRSAILLAELFPFSEIVCIDTWLGSKEMWTNHDDPERYGALRLRNGRAELQYEFMANAIRAGKQHQITPMPLPSSIALSLLRDWKVRPELIYLDASHEYQDVCDDITRAMALQPKVLAGDDYTTWPGVEQAVRDTLGTWNVPVTVEENGFWHARRVS